MTDEFTRVTKEQAKKMIDDSPGDFIIIGKISTFYDSNLYSKGKYTKDDGQVLIVNASEIRFQDNDFFGNLILKEIKEPEILSSILFPIKR